MNNKYHKHHDDKHDIDKDNSLADSTTALLKSLSERGLFSHRPANHDVRYDCDFSVKRASPNRANDDHDDDGDIARGGEDDDGDDERESGTIRMSESKQGRTLHSVQKQQQQQPKIIKENLNQRTHDARCDDHGEIHGGREHETNHRDSGRYVGSVGEGAVGLGNSRRTPRLAKVADMSFRDLVDATCRKRPKTF
jgi:hypothetical protein